ncbi:MAG: hypothetical protein WCP97_07315 [bacterium]
MVNQSLVKTVALFVVKNLIFAIVLLFVISELYPAGPSFATKNTANKPVELTLQQ